MYFSEQINVDLLLFIDFWTSG